MTKTKDARTTLAKLTAQNIGGTARKASKETPRSGHTEALRGAKESKSDKKRELEKKVSPEEREE